AGSSGEEPTAFPMIRRKLPIATFAATALAVAVVVPAGSASGEARTLLVTLQGGQQLTVTVDVPPGTPVDQIEIPGVTGTIVSVEEVTPPPAPAAPPATATTPPATVPAPTPQQPAPADPADPPAPTTPAPPAVGERMPEVEAPEPRGGDPRNGPQAARDGKPQQKRQKVTDEPEPEAE